MRLFPLSDFTIRLALTLAHFLWQGAAVALAAALAGRACRALSARARYGVDCTLMLALALCPLLTFFVLEAPRPAGARTDSIPVANVAAVQAARPVETSLHDGASGNGRVLAAPVQVSRLLAGDGLLSGDGLLDWTRFAPLIASAYLLGLALMLGRLFLGIQGGRRLCRLADQSVDPETLDALARGVRALGLRAAPAIAYCHKVAVPTLVGVLYPTILLPLSLASGLAPAQVDMLILHELAHLSRRDHLVLLAQRTLEALLFFHPAVWWLSRRLNLERELCCDDLVVAAGYRKVHYAQSLLRVAELSLALTRPRPAASLALGAAGPRSSLSRRIVRLVAGEPAEPVRFRTSWPLGVLMLASLALAIPCLKSAGAPQTVPAAPTRTPAVEATPAVPKPSAAATPASGAGALHFTLTPSPITAEKQGSSLILKQTITAEVQGANSNALKLQNVNGNFAITGWDEPRTTIEVEKRVQISGRGLFNTVSSSSRQEAERSLQELTVNVKPMLEILDIKTIFPKPPSGVNLSVNFIIKVPRAMLIDAETNNGNGRVVGIQKSARIHTNNGNLTVNDIGGDLDAISNNGNIDLKNISGNAKAGHANGNIQASGIGGNAAFSGNNGNIQCQGLTGSLEAQNENGNIHIEYAQPPADGRKISIKSKTGTITLALPGSSAFTLDARTNIGHIASQFPVAISGKGIGKTASGQVGAGGPRISVETGIGQITINKR